MRESGIGSVRGVKLHVLMIIGLKTCARREVVVLNG